MSEGVLVVNKPQGPTSHDVVAIVRRRLGLRRIGHTGTLDPMAEGVLVLLIGRATRRQQALQTHAKRYETVIRLGTQTDTGDAWGRVIRRAPVATLSRHTVEDVLASLVGRHQQVPPPFSAVKIRGRPLYWWTRRGVSVAAAPRPIEIFSAELMDLSTEPREPEPGGLVWRLRCGIMCSSGTYIRSLAEEIAARLGTVGHVEWLRRQAVGPWTIEQAKELEWIKSAGVEALWQAVQPLEEPHAHVART